MSKIIVLSVVVVIVAGLLMANSQLPITEAYDCSAQSAIPVSECNALKTIYNATGGAGWDNKSGWLISNDPCSWYGVICYAGKADQLALSYNNLTGLIPIAIKNLTSLTVLYFQGNEFTGNIPVELGSMTSLFYLRLDDNQLTGSIPPELGNLSNLGLLYLSGNDLTGDIPSSLGNLSNLMKLDLAGNQLSGSIPSQLGNLFNLTDLTLNQNNLSGVVPASLGNLSQLVNMRLNSNLLLAGILPLNLTNLSNMDYFSFYETALCEPDNAAYGAWKAGITNYYGTGTCVREMFYSQSTYDGWVLESGENTGAGGTLNTNNLTCLLGDDAAKKQYRTILHFNTSRIPDNAVITKIELQYKELTTAVSGDPYATLGKVWADIKLGYFSNNAALVVSDFGAASSLNNAGYFVFTPSATTYPIFKANLKATAFQYLNLAGSTQFRLRFAVDDDNDAIADYIKLFCGDMPEPFNRPVLRVWYYVP